MTISERLASIKQNIPEGVTLVAVSKTKSPEEIGEAYDAGQRIFGENKVQELAAKQPKLPDDIEWHMIGHLQRNKVKYIAPFVALIHGVDSLKLLREIDKQAKKNERIIPCLLQIHIAQEATKFGMDEAEAKIIFKTSDLENVKILGLMGMATFTTDEARLRKEFGLLKDMFDRFNEEGKGLSVLSMGMSGDYKLAIDEGSTMVRIGSSIFGARNYG